mgnify:FL=1
MTTEEKLQEYANYYLTLSPIKKVRFLEKNFNLGKLKWYQRIYLMIEFTICDLKDKTKNIFKKF